MNWKGYAQNCFKNYCLRGSICSSIFSF